MYEERGMITPTQSKMARAALGWSIVELAEAASIGKNTVLRMEAGDNITTDTLRAIEASFRDAGVSFPEPHATKYRPKE
jgi:transcriptional regulator with XRE-family HTH domain